MTFRQPTSLSVLGKATSIFSSGTFQANGASQFNRKLVASGIVTAGLMGVFTFGVGVWTIGGWVFGSDPSDIRKTEMAASGPDTSELANELAVKVTEDSATKNIAKPEIKTSTTLAEVAGTEQKIRAARNDTSTASSREQQVSVTDAASDDVITRASNIASQYAEALVGIGGGAQSIAAVPGLTPPAQDPEASALEPRTVTVSRGDTLMALMVGAGAGRSDAHEAITALRKVYSPRRLRPGQDIELTFSIASDTDDEEANAQGSADDSAAGGLLMGLTLQSAVDEIVQVARAAASDDFVAEAIARPLERQVLHGSGTIDSSLFVAARNAGIPNSVMIELIRAFSYDVDFQREIQPGDKFDLVYEAFYDNEGKLAKTGKILVASLSLSGAPLNLYGFTPSSGFTDFFDEKGQAVRKALLRTPVDGARLSSGFGRRKHPILGYTKMHKGLDFAAPRGTPIYAAGDGVIESAGRNGSYGKYVRIRHHSGYKTAYAHMKGYGKGVKKGKRVKQGQIIGYIGTTGRSTGPHLHYEVLLNNKQVNPRKIKLPAGEKLKKKDLENFQAHRAEIDQLRQDIITGNAQMVQAKPADCRSQQAIDESGAATTSAASSNGC